MKFEINRLPPGASDEEIKNEIKRVAELIPDTVISQKKFDELSKISTSALRNKFGSWENVLKLCGLEHRYSGITVSEKMKFKLKTLPKGASDEEIKNEVKRVAGLIPSTIISQVKFDELSKISVDTLRRRFGSWKNALKLCGLEYRYSGQPVSEKMKNQIAKKMSDVELIDELKRVAKQVGKNELSQSEFNENSEISANAIYRRFGSWTKGLELAGLEAVKMGKRYTELEYFENLLNVWTHYGRQPFYREMDASPSKISSGGYERRFKKWTSALQAFVEYINNEEQIVERQQAEMQIVEKKKTITTEKKQSAKNQQVEIQIIKEKKTITPEERRDISLGLRYKVLSKDRFKCVKCGNSPSTDINCKLHIDHIVPFSKGGLTVFENLQTLCNSCNLGKGNRFDE